jgi:UDP-N-acetylmuramate--alanine ligase
VDRDGLIVACIDDEGVRQVLAYAPTRGPRAITYGLKRRRRPARRRGAFAAGAGHRGRPGLVERAQGHLEMAVPGVHNVRNALAALAVGVSCGVPIDAAVTALRAYRGSARRFEWKGEEAASP